MARVWHEKDTTYKEWNMKKKYFVKEKNMEKVYRNRTRWRTNE